MDRGNFGVEGTFGWRELLGGKYLATDLISVLKTSEMGRTTVEHFLFLEVPEKI